jgi:hypothetical protein
MQVDARGDPTANMPEAISGIDNYETREHLERKPGPNVEPNLTVTQKLFKSAVTNTSL